RSRASAATSPASSRLMCANVSRRCATAPRRIGASPPPRTELASVLSCLGPDPGMPPRRRRSLQLRMAGSSPAITRASSICVIARALRRSLQHVAQLVDEPNLARDQLLLRDLEREPGGAVDLGERLLPARARRPLHDEGVAHDRVRIAVALERPGVHHLAARLPARAERDELALGHDPGLLGELPLRRRERVLARRELALGDRPGAAVALGPERPARVDQKHLRCTVAAPEHQQTRAGPRHHPSPLARPDWRSQARWARLTFGADTRPCASICSTSICRRS